MPKKIKTGVAILWTLVSALAGYFGIPAAGVFMTSENGSNDTTTTNVINTSQK